MLPGAFSFHLIVLVLTVLAAGHEHASAAPMQASPGNYVKPCGIEALGGCKFWNVPSREAFLHFLAVQFARPFSSPLRKLGWFALLVSLVTCANPWVLSARRLKHLRLSFHRYAQNRGRAIVISALFPVVVRVALLPLVPVSPPSVHDEFSWLLMADTFRSGRLTNPVPAFWPHYETIHEIIKPTYSSMYPPVPGALLALGQLLGVPWIGVLLSVGLMCGTLCWMLQGWAPAPWAFGGALLAGLQIGIAGYWMNSFFGAAAAALAGALTLGVIPRLVRQSTRTRFVIFAAGIVLLVNTRPFEGSCLAVFSILTFLVWYRAVGNRADLQWSTLIPAALVLIAGAGFTTCYNWRVTGNPFKPAYVVNHETYGWPENLAVLPPQKVMHHHQNLRDMHLWELGHRANYWTFGRMLNSWGERAATMWEFYLGPALFLPFLLALPVAWRSTKLRIAAGLVLLMLALNTIQLMAYPQHVAAQSGLFFLLVVTGFRRLYILSLRNKVVPERMIAALFLTVSAGSAMSLFAATLHIPQTFWEQPKIAHGEARAGLLSRLAEIPGRHLVFVNYSEFHNPHEEWVYNSAEIETSRVVWANAMGYEADKSLRNHFPDRQAWIIEPDEDPHGFLPFSPQTDTSRVFRDEVYNLKMLPPYLRRDTQE